MKFLLSSVFILLSFKEGLCGPLNSTKGDELDRSLGNWMQIPDGDGLPVWVDLDDPGQETVLVGARDVTFTLYSRRNPVDGIQLLLGDLGSLQWLDRNEEIKFVIHGWNSKGKSLSHVKRAFVETSSENVIVTDWSGPASGLYSTSRRAVKNVGAYVAQFIDFLVLFGGVSPSKIHLVGHSLGAHVAGVAGNRVNHGRVAKITGLDPAAPGYGSESLNDRLDVSDANYVQVIHTNAGLLGWTDPMGHIDFYPNGGRSQLGCGLDLAGTCSHSRAHEFYAESVYTPVGFWGALCNSWADYNSNRCGQSRAIMGARTNRL
uniref:Lipase domain-containing protein n=1 Tax=Timema shepardi TaxID=629360 RepID=A0A7R9AZX1_TIMSH|nr:unnamed protein product [Timema shepardi]